MKSNLTKFALSAGIMLAMALTLSCSGGDDNGGGTSSTSGGDELSSSSVGGGGDNNSSSSVTSGGGGSSSPSGGGSTFKDTRDGTTYKTTKIGDQTWLAENLNYDVPGNDTDVCYDNDPDKCKTYGRLYNWSTAMGGSGSSTANPSGVQGVCPSGWHLPSDAEWTTLTTFVGTNPGTKLKADSPLWNSNGKGTDEFGFSALPGGSGYSSGSFLNVGSSGYWWSATEGSANGAYGRYMSVSYEYVIGDDFNKNNYLFSVRCIQN
jgi:uncharacterized protein (TIGR02145 family)